MNMDLLVPAAAIAVPAYAFLMGVPLAFVFAKLGLWTIKFLAFVMIIFIIAVIHELGHHLVAKACGVRVDEFSVGLGNLLYSRRWGETLYCVRSVPLAAYVKPAGMDPDEAQYEGYVDPGERSFSKKNSLVKHLILLAGPAFNILSTVFVLTMVNAFVGVEETTIRVRQTTADWPAAQAGILPGDIFLAFDGETVDDMRSGIGYIQQRTGVPIKILVQRGTETFEIHVVPRDRDGAGLIGILSEAHVLSQGRTLPFGSAFSKALISTGEAVIQAYQAAIGMIQKAFRGRVPAEIGGPVSIVVAVGNQVETGDFADRIRNLVRIFALLSMAIGVFNLLPIPALDGGRMSVILIKDALDLIYLVIFWKWPAKSILNEKFEQYVHLIGIIVLLGLLVLVTFKDISDVMTPPQPQAPSLKDLESPPSPSP